MNHAFFLLWLVITTAISLNAQVSTSVAGTGAGTQEVFVSCIPNQDHAAALTLESLSAHDVKITNVAPLGDRPIDYVWLTDYLGSEYGTYMLNCCTRPGVDRGSVILGNLAAEGYASDAKQIELWTAKRLQEAKSKRMPVYSLSRDVMQAGITKVDEISRGGLKILFVSGDLPWSNLYPGSDTNIDLPFLDGLQKSLLINGVHMFVWDTHYMKTQPLFNEKGVLNDPADSSGGWLFVMFNNAKLIEEQQKKLVQLFKSWYTVSVQTPSATKNDQFLKWNLTTTAECRLTAPSRVAVRAKSRGSHN